MKEENPLITEMKRRERKKKLDTVKALVVSALVFLIPYFAFKIFGRTGFWVVVTIGFLGFLSFLFFDVYDIPGFFVNYGKSNSDDWPDPKGPHGY